ncbi:MAG: hypothetical protein ACOX5R_18350 [bacterium]|jgi:hypothetical protein
MRMSSWKLVALRIFMTTVGRWGWLAERFKQFMIYYTIQRKGEQKYVASSRYFTWDQLD